MSPEHVPLVTETRPAVLRFWVRADAPLVARDRARSLVRRAEHLPVETGIEQWPSRVPLAEDHRLAAAYESFEAWADGAGVSLEPAFRRTRHDSLYTDEHEELLVTPVCCLSVESEDGVAGVFPHRHAGGTVTIEDAMGWLDETVGPYTGSNR